MTWIVVWIAASLAGQLIAPPVWSAGIARRFGPRRGLALGLATCGFAAANAATPLLLVNVIGLAGWRHFYLGMAGFLLLVLLPLTFLFYRESPPVATVPAFSARTPANYQERGASFVGEILLTQRFVQFGTLVFLVSFVVGGMMIHLQPLFRTHGLSAAAAASAYALYGVGGIAGRLGGGWALDRFDRGPAPALPMCIFPVLAAGLALIAAAPSLAVHALIALLIGVAAGVEVDVVPYLVRRYFPAASIRPRLPGTGGDICRRGRCVSLPGQRMVRCDRLILRLPFCLNSHGPRGRRTPAPAWALSGGTRLTATV